LLGCQILNNNNNSMDNNINFINILNENFNRVLNWNK
jgi:hypothetical protein